MGEFKKQMLNGTGIEGVRVASVRGGDGGGISERKL